MNRELDAWRKLQAKHRVDGETANAMLEVSRRVLSLGDTPFTLRLLNENGRADRWHECLAEVERSRQDPAAAAELLEDLGVASTALASTA